VPKVFSHSPHDDQDDEEEDEFLVLLRRKFTRDCMSHCDLDY